MTIKELLQINGKNQEVSIKGWVRTRRGSKHVSFIALNDGSTINNIQIVAEGGGFNEDLIKQITTGSCISVEGKLVNSKGSGQSVEILASLIEILGVSDPEEYPLQPKKHSLEFLREKAHLRFRTNTFSAIFRLRHALTFAVHKFFNDKGFINLHTPIITTADAEGAGEMFRVTTLDIEKKIKNNYKDDFFGKEVNLTVSGQLNAELVALGLSEVYTFGPTFRAENSNTSRHLAEFWMIEPEMAFYDIKDNMDLAEEMLKYLVKYTLDNCKDDLSFLEKAEEGRDKQKPMLERQSLNLTERLKLLLMNDYIYYNIPL